MLLVIAIVIYNGERIDDEASKSPVLAGRRAKLAAADWGVTQAVA